MDKKTILERFELAASLYKRGYKAIASSLVLGSLEEAVQGGEADDDSKTAPQRGAEKKEGADVIETVASLLKERGFDDLARELEAVAAAEGEGKEGDTGSDDDEEFDIDIDVSLDDEDEDDLDLGDEEEEGEGEEDEDLDLGDEEEEEEEDMSGEGEGDEGEGEEEEDISLDDLLDEEEEEGEEDEGGEEEDEEEDILPEDVKASVARRLRGLANRLASYNDPKLRKHGRRILALAKTL